MPVRRMVDALSLLFAHPADGSAPQAAESIPPVPLQIDAPDGWRCHESFYGPYRRYAVSYPRDWHALAPASDPVHLQPPPRSELDLAVTLSASATAVLGPQGILDAVERLAEARGLDSPRSEVSLDRWGEDGWAGCWAWNERRDGLVRAWRLLVLGHDQQMVYVMVNGSKRDVEAAWTTCERILASVRLPPADLLAPEFFPLALAELLNDRRSPGEAEWSYDREGNLVSGNMRVRLGDLYRGYLADGDLDGVAAALDVRAPKTVEGRWSGRTWDEVAGRLRVVLRRQEAIAELNVVGIPLDGGLVACPVLDADDHMAFIPAQEPDRWGVEAQDLLTRAVATLDGEGEPQLQPVRDGAQGPIRGYRIVEGDGYDSGRLLGPSLRARLEAELGADLLVAMPSAGFVLVLKDDARSREGLARTAERGFVQRPRPLSRSLWLWTEAGLELLGS